MQPRRRRQPPGLHELRRGVHGLGARMQLGGPRRSGATVCPPAVHSLTASRFCCGRRGPPRGRRPPRAPTRPPTTGRPTRPACAATSSPSLPRRLPSPPATLVGVGVAARAAAGGVAVIGVAVPAGQVRACTRASARTAVGMMAAAAAAAAAGQAAAAAAAARTAAVVLSVLAARGGAPSVAATSRTTLPADQRVLPVAPAPTADEGTVGVAAHVAAEGGASRRRSVMTRCGRAFSQGPSLCLYAESAR